MNSRTVVLVALAVALWLLGSFVGMAPRLAAIMLWVGGFFSLGAALYFHIRGR